MNPKTVKHYVFTLLDMYYLKNPKPNEAEKLVLFKVEQYLKEGESKEYRHLVNMAKKPFPWRIKQDQEQVSEVIKHGLRDESSATHESELKYCGE